MRPAAHATMYGQPAYVLPQNVVQYYAAPNCPPGNAPQYGRNPQVELAQPMAQPVYLAQPMQAVMQHGYQGAVVGVPTQVMGSPVPQAVAIQGVPAYAGAQGWAYRPAMVEASREAVWGYGGDRSRPYGEPQPQQEPRAASNWPRAIPQAYGGNGAGAIPGRADGHGSGGGGFQGRVDGGFHGRGEGHGNGNGQSFGKGGGEGRRPDRGYESGYASRHYSSGAPGRQYMNRQGAPPQSPAPLQAKQLSCEACEKTFAVPSQYTAHMNTHVQCDENGCSFSASGKVVKEHKLTTHSKSSNPSPMSAVKAGSKRSLESDGEIKSWRDERRRNYPTQANVQRKKDILEGKVARGELIDEDARKRRQRMKEILARQAELGVPVAEVPAYYLTQTYRDDRAKGRKSLDPTLKQVPAPAGDGTSGSMSAADSKKRKPGEDADTTTATTEERSSKSARMDTHLADLPTPKPQCENPEVKAVEDRDDAGTSQPSEKPPKTACYFYQRGRCRKGSRCHFAHTRGKKGGEGEGGRKGGGAASGGGGGALEKKRPPTLLSKLLQAEITRDKSYILQCLRFFVSNNFFVDGIVQSTHLTSESDAAEESSDYYSEGEVVEAPDMLSADTAIINTLLSERPEVFAKVIEMESQA